MKGYTNKFYLKSSRNLKDLFKKENLLIEEKEYCYIDCEKIEPCPKELKIEKFDPKKNKNKLLEKYKDNISLFGHTDAFSWKESHWGCSSNLIKGEFINNDTVFVFKLIKPPLPIFYKITENLSLEKDACLDFFDNEDKDSYGRIVFFSEEENESFFYQKGERVK